MLRITDKSEDPKMSMVWQLQVRAWRYAFAYAGLRKSERAGPDGAPGRDTADGARMRACVWVNAHACVCGCARLCAWVSLARVCVCVRAWVGGAVTRPPVHQVGDMNPFCAALKDEAGRPVNVRVQQDAFEFLNTFFDRLEATPAEPSPKGLIAGVFGGSIVSQVGGGGGGGGGGGEAMSGTHTRARVCARVGHLQGRLQLDQRSGARARVGQGRSLVLVANCILCLRESVTL